MLYFIITALMFSLFEVVSKNLQIPPLNLTFIRFIIGGSILFPIGLAKLRKSKLKLTGKSVLKLWALGILLMLSCILLQTALINTSVSLCVFIYCLNTIHMSLLGWIIFKEKPVKIFWLTCAIVFIGLIIITDPFGERMNIYTLYAIASSILFSLFNILIYKTGKVYGNIISSSISFLTGALSMGVILIIRGANLIEGATSSSILPVLILGIICSGVVYLMYYKTMEALSVSIAGSVFLIKPVLATTLAAIFLHERITIDFLIGSILILLGTSIPFILNIYKKTQANRNQE